MSEASGKCDAKHAAAEVIATWPVGTFLENIALLPDGRLAISAHNRHEIHLVGRDGSRGPVVAMPASPAGLVVEGESLFAVGGDPGVGPHHVYRVSPRGLVETWLAVDGSLFLNGFTPAAAGRAWAVDSILGAIFSVDLVARTARVALRHELLGKATADPVLPGANGVKQGDDALYVTNTERALVLRVPLNAGEPTGNIEVLAEALLGDDLALNVTGDLLVTNHIRNTLTRVAHDGTRSIVAGPEEGMAGSTACAFGPDGDRESLYVTTTGGMIQPLDGIVREAKLVRLRLETPGRPIGFAAAGEGP